MQFPISRPLARIATTVALAGTLGLSGGAAVMAQGATPAAGPDPSQCVAPAETAAPVASPADGAAMATPALAEELPAGTVVEDEAVIAEATAAIENLYACYNAGDGVSYVSLYTDTGILANWGELDRAALADDIATISGMAPAHSLEVHEVQDLGDGSYVVDYQIHLGKQVWHIADVIVDNGGTWMVDDSFYFTAETELDSTTASVKASMADGELVIEVSPNPIMNQPAVKLQLANEGDSPLYFVLLQGGDAASLTNVDLASLPEGVTFIGEDSVLPGERFESLFEDLEEGSYVIYMEAETGESATFDLTIDPPFDPNA
ncbi:MAG TPA: hypothetical protein VD789_10845 [Thermomicrobiales bacterium]|nr:hypothetical protein [Thermomicrobiales bacterium]